MCKGNVFFPHFDDWAVNSLRYGDIGTPLSYFYLYLFGRKMKLTYICGNFQAYSFPDEKDTDNLELSGYGHALCPFGYGG